MTNTATIIKAASTRARLKLHIPMSAVVLTAARRWFQPAPPNAAAVILITAETVQQFPRRMAVKNISVIVHPNAKKPIKTTAITARITRPNSAVRNIGQTARPNASSARPVSKVSLPVTRPR